MRATITPREEMARNWGAEPAPVPSTGDASSTSRALNLEHILDLGNIIFFHFRGRAYGIPPLPWREGEKILAAWQEAKSHGPTLDRESLTPYFQAIEKLQGLLWRNCRPVGRVRRLLRWLGLHPNPFRIATEGEIGELALFMLGRRMSRAVRLPTPGAGNVDRGG